MDYDIRSYCVVKRPNIFSLFRIKRIISKISLYFQLKIYCIFNKMLLLDYCKFIPKIYP